jgi:hypothetical protein
MKLTRIIIRTDRKNVELMRMRESRQRDKVLIDYATTSIFKAPLLLLPIRYYNNYFVMTSFGFLNGRQREDSVVAKSSITIFGRS